MGKKRNHASFSSEKSIFNSSSSGNSSSAAQSSSGCSNDSYLSGLRRNFSGKRFKISSESQHSANNSQSSRGFGDDSFSRQIRCSNFSQNIESENGCPIRNNSTPEKEEWSNSNLNEYFSSFKSDDTNVEQEIGHNEVEDPFDGDMDFDCSLLPPNSFRPKIGFLGSPKLSPHFSENTNNIFENDYTRKMNDYFSKFRNDYVGNESNEHEESFEGDVDFDSNLLPFNSNFVPKLTSSFHNSNLSQISNCVGNNLGLEVLQSIECSHFRANKENFPARECDAFIEKSSDPSEAIISHFYKTAPKGFNTREDTSHASFDNSAKSNYFEESHNIFEANPKYNTSIEKDLISERSDISDIYVLLNDSFGNKSVEDNSDKSDVCVMFTNSPNSSKSGEFAKPCEQMIENNYNRNKAILSTKFSNPNIFLFDAPSPSKSGEELSSSLPKNAFGCDSDESDIFDRALSPQPEQLNVSFERILQEELNTKQNGNESDISTSRSLTFHVSPPPLPKHLELAALDESFGSDFTLMESVETLSTGSKENFSEVDKRLRHGMNRITRDKSLIYQGPPVRKEMEQEQKKELIKAKIMQIVQNLLTRAAENRPLTFKVRNQSCWGNCVLENDTLKLKPTGEAKNSIIKFASPNSRVKFAVIHYLLCKTYSLLMNNSICTQREIYYQHIKCLDSQSQIEVGMNIISSMLEVEPWHLPIVSSSKGLVFGDLTIVISSEEIIHCNAFGGTLIPQDVTKIKEFRTKAFFILVVEKDAIFKKLLDEDIPNKLTRPFIIVTGKGFPDINTRLFVRKLWVYLRIPVFILVDADPYGIDIMLTYRFGSLAKSHCSEQLAVPKMRWLGIHPSEIVPLNITRQPLEKKERDRIRSMLERPYVRDHPWLKRELNVLLQKNFKAEIEGVIKSNSYLTDFYLSNKFYSQDYF